jgi:L-aspartate oxidase
MSDDRRYLIPFRATLLPQIFTDTLVIGGGVAGLRAAISAREHGDVIVAAKGGIKDSNTYWAQGGVCVVVDENDTIDDHVRDTVVAGAGLCDEPIVRRVAEGARARVDELIEWGMKLDRAGDQLALGREGGHSHPRIVHADGDATGRELAMTLDRRVRSLDRVRFFDHCFVLDLITLDGSPPQCLGAITHHPKYGLQVIWAQATILATGGSGQVYRESTNPGASTGDGLAMAYRAGVELADLEFVQFHPTTLYVAGASRSLISEAVRGEGALLVDRNGYRFMPDYDERGELAPRDIVSRSILQQMATTNHTNVYLDVRHLGNDRFATRFPGIYGLLRKFDIDPATQTIPIHPSAHYMVGGVRTDDHGRTNIQGLYAAGEVAATGLHGANRLASNSLLEGLVFGEITGRICGEQVNGESARSPFKVISDIRPSDRSELDLADVRSSLRSVMWRHVGIERQGERLDEVAEMFDFWARYTLDKIFDDRGGWEVQNLLTVGSLINLAARQRTESRGCHHRLDYPEPDDAQRHHTVWQRGVAGPTTVDVAPSGNPAHETTT